MENPPVMERGQISKLKKSNLFQKAVRIGTAAAIIGTLITSDNQIPVVSSETINPTPSETTVLPTPMVEAPEFSEKDLTTKFIKEMKLKYGIDITVDTAFFDKKDSARLAQEYNLDEQPKDYLSKSEINTLRDALGTLSFCPQLVDGIGITRLPSMRNYQNDYTYVGGEYQPKVAKGDKNHIYLYLSNNLDLTSPTLEHSKLGIKTQEEMLKKMFFHECGHKISNMVLRAAYSENEYLRIIDPTRGLDYLRDKKNPLFIAFSRLEGWQVTKAFNQDLPKKDVYVKPVFDDRMVYRPTRFSIEEHFAELWGLSVANSPVLTDKERKFFQKIYDGLEKDPQKFAKRVARDPMMLLVD